MRDSCVASYGLLAVGLALALISPATVAGQAQPSVSKATSASSDTRTVRRTPDGRPDLQGLWSFGTLTPFERPSQFAGKEKLSDDEAEEFARKTVESGNKDRRDGGGDADVARAYNDFWWDIGTTATTQTSLVVDPPDGRLPPLTPQAEQERSQRRNLYDNPEERPFTERCILGLGSGPPMVPSVYNNNVQIVQTRDYVVIVNEMIHSARIVAMNGRSHPPAEFRSLTGDSIGRWEGDTLVVDTSNFLKERAFRGASRNMHLVERFTRVDRDTLRYEFTVDDPATWTKRWSARVPMRRSDELMFEYACHENNYGLEGVLRGARYQDTHGEQKPK